MAYVVHHLVPDRNRFGYSHPAWADRLIIKAYATGDWTELIGGGAPSKGGAIFEVQGAANLAAAQADGAVLVGGNDLTANTLTSKQRSVFLDRWGVTIPGDVLSPAHAMIRVLGVDAHPDGELGPRPIMPTTKGLFTWVCGKPTDLIVPSERFNTAFARDNSHFANPSKVLDCCRLRIKLAHATHGTVLARKVGGFEAMTRFGIALNDLSEFSRAIMPLELRSEKLLPPETTITDIFTASDGPTVAGWTKVAGAFSIVSNKLEDDTPGVNAGVNIRNDTALSGVDHFAQAQTTLESASSNIGGPAVRFSASASTFYGVDIAGANSIALREVTGGGFASLVSATVATGASTKLLYIQVDGSVIYAWMTSPATFAFALTDVSIPGNSQVGLYAFALTTGNNQKWDDFRAQDFSGGTPVARLINGGRVHV